MAFHWKVLIWMAAGVLVGLGLQATFDAPAHGGITLEQVSSAPGGQGATITSLSGPALKSRLEVGDTVLSASLGAYRGEGDDEISARISGQADLDTFLQQAEIGAVLWLELTEGRQMVTLVAHPDSPRLKALAPFNFVADIFMALLKMLIVPLVVSSIVTGVAGVGNFGDLRRLGLKTFGYYIATSLLAILVGQALVSIVRPGDGAHLGLAGLERETTAPDASFIEVLQRMVPENIFSAMTSNGAMLQVIFFALLFGVFITRVPSPHGKRVGGMFESFFQVMLKMAEGILALLPYGVFALLVRVVGLTGFGIFTPLLKYMAVVVVALLFHAGVTLPLIVRFVGRMSPLKWFRAMSPALMTAFSTSSSSMTLPVTLKTVEERGKVSNRVTSFTLPLGATINMDGTALYECIGVIFLSQYYAATGDFELTISAQCLVVLMALLASIGAAGIPSAGLVMMLTILAALGLPLEGAALLLAVDRPLDMLRTVVNVWSDSCGAAVIARTEGETGPLEAGG